MEKRAEAFPTHGPPPSMILYVCGFFSSHCLRSEDTIGWQGNAEKLTTDTKDRERRESNTFPLLFLFSAPCFLCLPSSNLEPGMSNPFPSRLDQLGAAEFTRGWSLRQKHTGPNILLMMTEWVLCYQTNNWFKEPTPDIQLLWPVKKATPC